MENNLKGQHRQPIQGLIKQKRFVVDKLLSQKFNQFIESEDYDAAFRVLKQAIKLNYPRSLINSWEQRLDHAEDTHRHPLDCAQEASRLNSSQSFRFGPNLRSSFQVKLKDYFIEKKIIHDSIDEIVELAFDSLNEETGTFLVPDLTAYQPDLNLITYFTPRLES